MIYIAQIGFYSREIRARNPESALRKAVKLADKYTKSVKILLNGIVLATDYLRPKTQAERIAAKHRDYYGAILAARAANAVELENPNDGQRFGSFTPTILFRLPDGSLLHIDYSRVFSVSD
jgi:hypothetical protein